MMKSEKETLILTNEADDYYEVFTFNLPLKRRLREFSKKFPECCELVFQSPDGAEKYLVQKGRLSIRLTAPYSEERKQKARKQIKLNTM